MGKHTIEDIRRHNLKRCYGMSLEDYEARVNAQGGKCAICGRIPGHTLNVDHDHASGKVRGLLCSRCNTALGAFADGELFPSALAYLKRNT